MNSKLVSVLIALAAVIASALGVVHARHESRQYSAELGALERARDDSIDWTLGWTGRIDNAVVIQRGDDGDNGFEWDNWEFGFDFTPRSMPQVTNVTLVGLKDVPGVENGSGGRLRNGTAGLITNAIWTNFGRSGLRIVRRRSRL